jgi:hypothetical protein
MPFRSLLGLLAVVVALGILAAEGCANRARPTVPARAVTLPPTESAAAWTEAQQVFESRCVVCHGCYDAPCQLKLGTYEGITRGATSARVYDASRLVAADPTRLGVDAHDVEGWRQKGFHSVLAEGPGSDPRASLLLRMLALKDAHPLSTSKDLGKDFTLDLDRGETCTTAERFEDYAKSHPLWGMPYALPGLDEAREKALVRWVEAGAPYPRPDALAPPVARSVDEWETFLNEPSLKSQLVARYIYEHLFLASLYFEGVDDRTFFRLVRSRTPVGAPVDEIPTRRPFEDPKVPRVYYRLVLRLEHPLEKTHMPYPLSATRLRRYRELFFEPKYEVTKLPGYDPEVASNPFRVFQVIPAGSRYRFMLDEAQFTMMGFIKGPVCRGQVALDVIEDRFWVFFIRPDAPGMTGETDFLAGAAQDLDLPAGSGSTALPTLWFRYSSEHTKYVAKRNAFLMHATRDGKSLTPDVVWDGDGTNANAALTVFRHFDSATVVQGLAGRPPKTAWVVGYPLLERIHYLLVAGFDIFGNVSHQVETRLYMDFLRMEGEATFLMLLPPERRRELTDFWYRGVTGQAKQRVADELEGFPAAPPVAYTEKELFEVLRRRVQRVLPHALDLETTEDEPIRSAADALSRVHGRAASAWPESSFLTVTGAGGAGTVFTVLRDSAHTNVAHLFHEDARRLPDEDELTVVRGFLGAYPNALFEVSRADLAAFVEAASKLDGAEAYRALRQRFGVSRAGDRFWPYSDRINDDHRKRDGVAAGLFDYNRLDSL